MPDQLAHFIFARRVLAAAQPCIRKRISADSPAFRAGTFGPDPLFNDPSPRRRAEGFELHRLPGHVSLNRMRESVRQHMPWAADYAAGFFCHYALDRLCHPDIKAMAARGVQQHVAIEAAYDRRLLLKENIVLPRRIALSPSALRAASQMYRRVGPGRFRADLEAFWQIRRFLALSGGTTIADIVGRVHPDWNGLIPHRTPSAELLGCFDILDELINAGIAPAAEQLSLYFEAIERNLPLSPWTNENFSGFQTQL